MAQKETGDKPESSITIELEVDETGLGESKKMYMDDEEKMSYMEDEKMDLPMAMSFDELEAAEEIEEKTGKLKELAKRFWHMTQNIFGNPMMTPEDKTQALGKLTDEFNQRVSGTAKAVKQMTKTEGGIEYKASDYADVGDPEKPSTWKLRLAEGRSGNFTVAQVARAITAMQPSGFRGNQVELTQNKSEVVNRIDRAINGLSATKEQKDQLKKRLQAVKSLDGFDSEQKSGFVITKSMQGVYRWLGWVTNNFEDREGEILTLESHKEYLAWLDENPHASPQLWTWHIAETAREKQVDIWGELDGFVVMGGELTEAEAKAFESLGDKYDLAMSHGFFVLNKNGNDINKYRTFEVSVLPRENAANYYTSFTLDKELNMAFSDKQRELVDDLHGKGTSAALENEAKEKAEKLQTQGVQRKETDETQQKVSIDTAEVVEALKKGLNLDGLNELITTMQGEISDLKATVKDLQESKDEAVAKEFEPIFQWGNVKRPSESKENIIKEDDPLKVQTQQRQNDWFGQALVGGGRQ